MKCNCNCECCKCNDKCGQPSSEIKVYGTLVNATLNPELANNINPLIDPDPCQAKNEPANEVESGHNDALAYAYQIHDGRFRQDDENLQPWERFQDEINKRVTEIVYKPVEGEDPRTVINNLYYIDDNGDEVKVKNCDCDGGSEYDDQWLKDIIGANPTNTRANDLKAVDLDGNGQADNIGDIINFILNLAAKLKALQQTVNNHIANHPSGGGECLWKTVGDHVIPVDEAKKVYGAGFYDTTVSNPS